VGIDHVSWRYAGASRIGTAHVALATPCQDAHAVATISDARGGPVLIAVVADGAGSAARSEIGAGLVCASVQAGIHRFVEAGGDLASCARAEAAAWLTAAHGAVLGYASSHDVDARELASTCLIVAAGPTAAVCVQIGDGAIVVDDGDGFAPVFWPQRGEYANTTSFLDAATIADAEFSIIARPLSRLAMFSDGIQMLALHYATRTAPATFYAGLFATLEAQGPGHSPSLDEALGHLLDRPSILQRTDDDRTLVLASRRPA